MSIAFIRHYRDPKMSEHIRRRTKVPLGFWAKFGARGDQRDLVRSCLPSRIHLGEIMGFRASTMMWSTLG
jgi:hypothetical protein